MGFTNQDAETLAAKLEALELTGDERALLELVFAAAADDGETSGFAHRSAGYVPTLQALALDLGPRSVVENPDRKDNIFIPGRV